MAVTIDWNSNFQNTINGKQVPVQKTRHGIDPATAKPNPEVPVATAQDLDDAVLHGRNAFKTWSKTPFKQRSELLVKFGEALLANQEAIAKLVVMETQKPLSMANREVESAAGWMKQLSTMEVEDQVVQENEERKVVRKHSPIGVVGAILPWNFPCSLICGKVGPVTITGNVVVVKPSPFTPYTALKVTELAQSIWPPGVVQCLSGGDDLGPWIVAHSGIDKISFTGSVATGKKVMEAAGRSLKKVTLELGGNDPSIICKSVDIAKVAPSIAMLTMLNSGQVCLCIKRVYIHESIYDAFRQALIAIVKSFKVGPGTAEGTFVGPVQNSMQYEKVKDLLNDTQSKGYTVALGDTKAPTDNSGFYITPTIIDSPPEDSRIVVEEPFGPIVPIMSWSDEEDVISRANNTKFGLGASVWTSDLAEGERIANRLEAGSVWVNSHADVSPEIPFGGLKESGVGVEFGIEGLKAFYTWRTVYLKKT